MLKIIYGKIELNKLQDFKKWTEIKKRKCFLEVE